MSMTLVYMSICYTNYSGEYELTIVISRTSDEIDMKVGQLSKLEKKYAMTSKKKQKTKQNKKNDDVDNFFVFILSCD